MNTRQQFKSINEKENTPLKLAFKQKPKQENKTKKPCDVSKQAIRNAALSFTVYSFSNRRHCHILT